MIHFDDFHERLEHEFENCPLSLIEYGYKVDGDKGIKLKCLMHAYKSVDYLFKNGIQGQFIEFSDLFRQHNNLMKEVQNLKKSNLDKDQVRKYVKRIYSEIPNELTTKLKDTISIVNSMSDYIKDIPAWVDNTSAAEFVVIYMDQNMEFVRLLDGFKDKINSSLPSKTVKKITFLPLSKFVL